MPSEREAPVPDDVGAVVPSRQEDVTVVLTELAGLLLDDTGVEQTLQRVIDVAVQVVRGCDAAGVTITAAGPPRTAAHTDERTLAIDADQYEAGEGPCLEAATTQTTQQVDLDEASDRWPAFGRAARADGVRSFIATPLAVRGESLGALNLYSRHRDGFGSLDEGFVQLLAGQASAAISNALRFSEAKTLATQLGHALESRAVIEQAKGVLISSLGVGAAQAFDVLRQESQRTNAKLREVAADVVERAQQGQAPRVS